MTTRKETDSLGAVDVPDAHYWGAQTQRSIENFKIGGERMPIEVIRAFGLQKQAAALANKTLGELPADLADVIAQAAAEVALMEVAFGEELAQTRRRGDPLRLDLACRFGQGIEPVAGADVEAVGNALHAQELLCRECGLEFAADFPFQLERQYHHRADEQQGGE